MHFNWNLILKRPSIFKLLRTFASINPFQLPVDRARCNNKGRFSDFKLGSTYTMRFYTTGSDTDVISSNQIDSLLRREQHTVVVKNSFLTRCDASHLRSNRPSEDRWFATKLACQEEGFLFGVLDGHGGEMCVENVHQRLPSYVAQFLLPGDNFSNSSESRCIDLFNKPVISAAHDFYNDWLCQESFKKLVIGQNNQLKQHMGFLEFDSNVSVISKALGDAFLQMDRDLLTEALISVEHDRIVDIVPYLTAVQSGSCALACYITEHHLFTANSGDCRVVAGVKRQDGTVAPQPLSLDQTAGNPREVTRILNEHPDVEAESLFVNGRLLGILTPMRAFGNAWLKWDANMITSCFNLLYGPEVSRLIPIFYESPPYLTALPEVTHHYLPLSGFQFLILASDGLWDLLSNEEAVTVVENYLKVRGEDGVVDSVTSNDSDITFDNVATALVRHALGGKNQAKLSSMLSLPFPQVRMYRDDITVMVIVFVN